MKKQDDLSAKIADDIKVYLKSGGKIQKLERGQSSQNVMTFANVDFIIDSKKRHVLSKK